MKRFTKQNPRVNPMQKVSYNVPMHWVERMEIKTFGTGANTYIYGDLVDKMGKYEDLGEPEEIARKLGVRPDWVK